MDGAARVKQCISLGLSILLVFTLGPGVGSGMAYQTTAPTGSGTTSSYSGQGVPLTAAELQSLVAPIALYPDPSSRRSSVRRPSPTRWPLPATGYSRTRP